jgi:hypothetical protein
MMSYDTHAEKMADEAVFALQFNTRDAVRYVVRNARIDEKTAQSVVRQTVTFHKQVKDSWERAAV